MSREYVYIDSPHESHANFNFPFFDKKIIIRFGTVNKNKNYDIAFPGISAIKKATDKIAMKELLLKGNVCTPQFIFYPTNDTLPLIYKKFNRSRGAGTKIFYDLKSANEGYNNSTGYLEQFVNIKREFRVHIADGIPFHIDEKLLHNGRQYSRIRNVQNGYYYTEPQESVPIKLIEESEKAVKSLGLCFGAVDVGICYDNNVWVFEVNTAPGMRRITRNKYQSILIDMIIRRGAKIIN